MHPPKNQTCSVRETSTYLLLLSQILSFRKGTAKVQNGSVTDPRFLESQPVRVEIRWDRLVIRLRFDRTKRGVESRTRSAPSRMAVPRQGGTARCMYCQVMPPSPETNAWSSMCAITKNAWNFMCAITNNAWNFICTITIASNSLDSDIPPRGTLSSL